MAGTSRKWFQVARLEKIFWAAGLPVIQGYGLTETSPVIAVNPFRVDEIGFGTVGPILENVEVKIAEDGEILSRGVNLMMGYYKAPELTAEVIDGEGWFHTGDIGVIEPEGQLRITGRKKEIFKTSLGKYISPEAVENKIKSSPVIDNAMVLGENQHFAAALVVPDFVNLRTWCKEKHFTYTTNAEMIEKHEVLKLYKHEIDKKNKQLGKTEQIRKFSLLPDEWTVMTGELTPTLKLRRSFVMEKYKEMIEHLFDGNGLSEKKRKTDELINNSKPGNENG